MGLIALLCGYIEHNFTFNFVALYIVMIALMVVLIFFVKEQQLTNRNIDGRVVVDFERAEYDLPKYHRVKVFALSYFMILLFGGLAIYTFNNYVNPDKNIFYNHDHHALKIEGMKVYEGFMVAGNNGQSFLDNSTISGSVQVASYDDEMVELQLNGVTVPIYTKYYTDKGAPLKDICINQESLFYYPSENKNDDLKVSFINRYDELGSNVTRLDLEILQRHEDHIFNRCKDSTLYIFSYGDRRDTSSFTAFLTNGYELQSIARDAYTITDLSGVNIIRPTIYRNLKNREKANKYTPQDYLIALEKQNEIKSISINGSDPISVDYKLRERATIKIPYGRAFYIGSGKDATASVKFEKVNDQGNGNFEVAIKYELPRYQPLSSTNRGRETTLMVTSSIVNAQDDPEASGLINNITENLVVAKLFENNGNSMHIKPFFVSYISDISSVDMLFRVLTDNGATIKSDIKAGEKFPSILSRDNNYEWIVSVENFKDTTPFYASKLIWILIVVIILSSTMMYISSVNYLYTAVECAAYLLLIAYLTVKLFLLWRVTVFSPVTSISFYEFHHYRDASWLNSIWWAIGAFYLIITIVKILIIHPITLSEADDRRVLMRYSEMRPSFWNKVLLTSCFAISMSVVALAWKEIVSIWLCWTLVIACLVIISILLKRVLEQHIVTYVFMGIVALVVIMAILSPFSIVAAMAIPSLLSAVCLVRLIALVFPKDQLKWVVCLTIVLVAGIYVTIERLLNMPMVRVLGGALIYFAMDWFIYKMFAKPYDESFRDIDRNETSNSNTAFVLSVWNMMCMSAATLYADGGYGIMFTLFMIFALWVKIIDVSNFSNYNHIERKSTIPVVLSLIMVALVGVIFNYKRIFLGLYNTVSAGKAWLFMLIAIVIVLLFIFAVMWVLNIKGKRVTFRNESISLPHLVIPMIAFVAMAFVLNFDILDKFTGGHTEYRIRVHMEKPAEVLAKVETDTQQNKFLQASLNDWILYEYQNIGEDIKAFGEDGNGYFKLQPQSKIGAMWFAQTTDICLSRYIIAEHGMMLAWLFVASFALFLLIALQALAVERWARLITIQVALLLAVQALMIFLANTRAFIFFGQDFPLISITSRLAAWYFVILMLLCVGAALFGKRQFNTLVRPVDMYDIYGDGADLAIRIGKRNQTSIYFICILFVAAAVSLYISGRNTDNAKGLIYGQEKKNVSTETLIENTSVGNYASYHDGIYDIEFLMALVNHDLDNHITPALKSYQRTLNKRVPLKRDMSAFVKSLFEYDTMKMAIDKCDSLTRRLLNNYIKSGSKHNRASNIICLRNVRTIDYQKVRGRDGFRVVYQDTLEFAMGVNAVNYQMPNRRRSQWCGSIIEQKRDATSDSVNIDQNNVLFIPKRITGGEDVQLVKADANRQLTVIGADGIIALSPNGVNVVNVRSSDYVIDGANGTLNNLPLQRNNYFAKNILINGSRAFIYPFGHKMFWARDIVANVITEYKKLSSKEKAEWVNKDVVLSVNSNLTSQIYNVYRNVLGSLSNKEVASDRSVIVADGDGKVRAMVDYRFNDKYRVNPNDYNRIAKISDSLFINFEKGRASETRYFGNFARNVLRRGPGSTQKPIVWTAVTTMYNTGWWKDLKLVKPVENDLTKENNRYYLFSKYAGSNIERQFRSLYYDEVGRNGLLDIQYYMYKSSNYYNSIMAYIGTYTKEVLNTPGFMSIANSKDHSTLFYKSSRPTMPVQQRNESDDAFNDRRRKWMEDCQKTFPEMKVSGIGGSNTLSFNRFLSAENANNDIAQDANALLPQGLSRNFDLPIYYDTKEKRPSKFFNIAVRKGRSSDRQLNEYMIRSVAIGNSTVWNVSPLDMAQMYGRLMTLNRGYKLSLYSFDHHTDAVAYEPFDIDTETWNNMANYLDVRNELIKGMSLVFSSSGTASGVKGTNSAGADQKAIVREYNVNGRRFVIKVDDGSASNEHSDIPTFYIYGKTGTINGYWNGIDKDDHLLSTIITDRPLTQCSVTELENVKYYVIYQVDYEHSGNGNWQNINGSIIRRVIESAEFMDYMGVN